MPKISVIMPVYNGEKYLKEAIDSILAQTYADFEFIIIDDGSSDSSPEIVKSYADKRIRFYANEENMGVARTLNRGLDLATGEYIARMDADDISLPKRFEKQAKYLDKHPKVGVLGCGTESFGEGMISNFSKPKASSAEYKANLFFNTCVAHPAVMIRKSAIKENRYEIEYNGLEDYVLWWRIAKDYKIYSLTEILLRYRKHKEQVTNIQVATNEYCKKFKKFTAERIAVLDKQYLEKELDILYKYCIGQFMNFSINEIETFIVVLGKWLLKNRENKYFNQKVIKKIFGLAMAYTIVNSIKDKKMILILYKKAKEAKVIGIIQYIKLYYHWLRR